MKSLILFLLTYSAAEAAEPLKRLTLEKAIEIAIQNHPSLAEAEANVEIAKARLAATGQLPNPEAIARIESAPFSGATSRAEYVAGVSQAAPIGGRLSAVRKVEEAGVMTRSREAEVAMITVTRNVRNAFATALFASEMLEAQTNNAASLRELVRITRARTEAGDLGPVDLARIESEEAQNLLEVQEARRLHHAAIDALASTMGDFRTHIESLSGSLDDTLQIAAIKAKALGLDHDHPAVQSAESEVKAQEARVKLAKAERIPDVNLDLLYRRLQASREDAFDFGVRVQIPLFDRKKRVRQAQQELRESEARYERVRNEIGHEQHELELQLQSALESAALLKDKVLPNAEKAVAVAEARFKAGDISLGDLLIVRRDHSAIRLKYAAALRAVMESWAGLQPVGR